VVALLADPDPDLFWPVLDELVERDPETGCVWTDDDELGAVDSTLGESVEPPRTLGAPAWWVPDLDEAWRGRPGWRRGRSPVSREWRVQIWLKGCEGWTARCCRRRSLWR